MMPDLKKFFDSKPKEFRVTRGNELDLLFDGWEVAHEEIFDYTKTKWTRVSLYLSVTGTYVASITQGGTDMGTSYRAAARKDFNDMLTWMREDNRGVLGPASKRVVATATERLPWLDGADVERV